MARSTFEALRSNFEDLELYSSAAAILLSERHASVKRKLYWDTCIVEATKKVKQTAGEALAILEDKDGLREAELAELAGVTKPDSAQPPPPPPPAGTGNVPPPPPAALGNEATSLVSPRTTNAMAAGEVKNQPSVIEPGTAALGNKDVWRAFYDRLKAIQVYHKKFGSSAIEESRDAGTLACEIMDSVRMDEIFSVDESGGKTLDLFALFQLFINLKNYRAHRELLHRQTELGRIRKRLIAAARKKAGTEPEESKLDISKIQIDLTSPEVQAKLIFEEMDMIEWLQSFYEFQRIPRWIKYRSSAYLEYLRSLDNYLLGFLVRQRPMMRIHKIVSFWESDIEAQFKSGNIPGWETLTHLMTDTYTVATDRLFASPEALEGHKKGKKYLAALKKVTENPSATDRIIEDSVRSDFELARLETRISKFINLLNETLKATIEMLRKKQSRRPEEIAAGQAANAAEEEEEEPLWKKFAKKVRKAAGVGPNGERQTDAMDAEDEEDAEVPSHNPLNLPVGFDGKPIPYWLYKLHGLGQEFKCEICGGYSYWGRRAFERHFQEWRHAFGMRCLKIPNTTHFKEITKIEDAINLFERLRAETESKAFQGEQEIEVEDADGNVMTLETYDDLRKQGLL